MSEDNNKKVNNEEIPEADFTAGSSPSTETPDIDEFEKLNREIDELVRTYSEGKPTREEQLRRKAEERFEKELSAQQAETEKMFSQDLEEATAKVEAMVEEDSRNSDGKMPLSEMLDIEAFAVPEKTEKEVRKEEKLAKKEEKARKKKKIEFINLDEKNALYVIFYSLGNLVYNILSRFFSNIFYVVSLPVIKFKQGVSRSTAGTKASLNNKSKGIVRELIYFRREIRSASKSILRGFRSPLSLPGILGHYISKAFNRHRNLLVTVINTALPILSALLLITVLNYWHNVTFALKVIYNGENIGCISDESVFTDAKELVMERLSSNSGSVAYEGVLDAGYELTLVSLDELNDAKTIADRMTGEKLTHACGIYIDNRFICAVKNEADAKTVFYNILQPYQSNAAEGGYVVGFAESIDYVQGLYRDNPAVIRDAAQLEKTVLGLEGATASYTVREADTPEIIATAYNTTVDELLSLNKGLTEDDIVTGNIILVPSYNRLVSIQKTITTTRIRAIPYETITQRDMTKYSGYRQVSREGVDGTERIIATRTYINGVEMDADVRYETVSEPVSEIIIVGSRTTFGGIYIGEASNMGFLWPAPSCHYISSPYGWRRSGWHKGIDLCTSNGTAAGTPVVASRSGRVEVVQHGMSGYGQMVLINHGDGYKTRYAHMVAGSITVNVGDYVDGGQVIGKVGSTGNSSGPHLHFEVIYNGETQDPKLFIS